MNCPDEAQRKRIVTNALAARTPDQLERATQELDSWVAAYPDDVGIQWAYEQMALVELALQETAQQEPLRQEVAPPPRTTLAKAS